PRSCRRGAGQTWPAWCATPPPGPSPKRGGEEDRLSPPPRFGEGAGGRGSSSLVPLLTGSEGTLAIVTEAELALVPRPKARGLLVPHFSSLGAAMDALAECLEFNLSAVELLDQLLLDLARGNLALKDTMAVVRGRPAAILMVEFSGEDPREVTDRMERLQRRLRQTSGVTTMVPAVDPGLRDALWSMRSAA